MDIVNGSIAAAAAAAMWLPRCRQMVLDVVIEVDGGRQNRVDKVTTGHVVSHQSITVRYSTVRNTYCTVNFN